MQESKSCASLPRIIPGIGSGRQASNLFISVGDLTPIETDL